MIKRMTKNHPVYKKFMQLEDKARELGISLTFHNAQACSLYDSETKQEFEIKDIEGTDYVVEQFPNWSEIKIVIETTDEVRI